VKHNKAVKTHKLLHVTSTTSILTYTCSSSSTSCVSATSIHRAVEVTVSGGARSSGLGGRRRRRTAPARGSGGGAATAAPLPAGGAIVVAAAHPVAAACLVGRLPACSSHPSRDSCARHQHRSCASRPRIYGHHRARKGCADLEMMHTQWENHTGRFPCHNQSKSGLANRPTLGEDSETSGYGFQPCSLMERWNV
jgi:hypothetical protein